MIMMQNGESATGSYNLGDFILPKKEILQPDGEVTIQPYKPPVVSDSSIAKNTDYQDSWTPYGNDIVQTIPIQEGIPYGDDMAKPIAYGNDARKPSLVSTAPAKITESYGVETWSVLAQPTDIPPGAPAVVAAPPPTALPSSDLKTIADIYGGLFPGGGDETIPPVSDGGPVLLYPTTYQRDVTAAKSNGPNPLIFVVIAALLLGGWFLYKKFRKGGSQ
jgi:hypothetical protein